MDRLLILIALMCTFTTLQAQVGRPGQPRQQEPCITSSWVKSFPFQSVGPSIFSGRVVDLAVNEDDPKEFLVAYATGGLWHTRTNGSSFTPIFDGQEVMTIGAVAADWTSGTLWVGTGEVNSSRSSYAGNGVYMSRDTGRTWTWRGLPESHHIGRILLYPHQPDTAWVAVLGHLYTPNPERGIYKTVDGGLTWRQTLFINDRAGAVDLLMDPHDPDILYASIWERDRTAWNMTESGPASGIYRSEDGGESWTSVTSAANGFPSGDGAGRIGLAMSYRGEEAVLYAVIDNQERQARKTEGPDTTWLTRDQLRTITRDAFLALDLQKLGAFLTANEFPPEYTAVRVKTMVRTDSIPPSALVDYLEDANAQLFDTPVTGAEIYLYHEGRWTRTHEVPLEHLFHSYGYYFGQIRAQPGNPDRIYVLGVPILRSDDGGHTFTDINGENVHGDHHALWLDPSDPGHLILGNDGGVNISYDAGESWIRANRPPVGQFYSVAVDDRTPFRIYGGLQDNGVWMGPSNYSGSLRWEMTGQYPYRTILGGDGMQVQVDPRNDSDLVYTGFQFGNYFRVNTRTGDQSFITPKPKLGDRPYRWNWQAPIHLSVHHPDILYMGAQKVLRSMDRGEHFTELSGDLTKGGRPGDVPFGTLTTIHESPLRFGLIYAGSDDGLIHVTRDDGLTWNDISADLPPDLWVSRVQASAHKESRVYASLNGYRQDRPDSWVFRSEDYGTHWTRIGTGLPAEPVNVIREDPDQPDLIYVGTDRGAYVLLDTGQTAMAFDGGLPGSPVHDLAIHKRSGTLVLGTHGRSFWTADIRPLRSLDATMRATPLTLLEPDAVVYRPNWGNPPNAWTLPNLPEVTFWAFSNDSVTGRWTISTDASKTPAILAAGTIDLVPGFNHWTYDLVIREENGLRRLDKERKQHGLAELKPDKGQRVFVPPGTYQVAVTIPNAVASSTLRVVEKKGGRH